MIEILQCLKKHGQRLDSEIAKETGMSLATARQGVVGLAATGAIVTCSLTRFEKRQADRGLAVPRIGLHSAAAPGRKAKPTT